MRPLVLGVLLATGLGCGKKSEEGKSAAANDETASKTADASAGKPEAPPRTPAVKPVTRAEAKARLDAWLKAQNDGDFEAYQAQYASKLVGIKRVRDKATTFDRDGWLADRKRMFRKAMVVEADDVRLDVDGKRPAVLFVQTWSSGTFKDKGPKRLTLAREGDEVLIAREEMLSSEVDNSHNKASAAIKAIEDRLGSTKGEQLEVGVPGLGGYGRRYAIDGEVVKVWDNLMADHQDYWLTIYYRDGKPFYVSYDSTVGEDVDHDENGGTAGKTRYTYREYLLSDTAITDAFVREQVIEGDPPADIGDRVMALPPKKLPEAIGDDALFKRFVTLGRVLAKPGELDDDAYEAARDGLID